ncbi:hypothetical protein [Pseudomonas sichuanensis]|uniref:hypothetical protein n=1 Tax=Pseudomonas sichuanensis TaxID=2213015 RepID=UPI002ABC4129|nr:hypothetical protein [Pseudomonas sichuanensis]MDZ4017393.1 hypothetical protein [Pseudomonas sichuanensis]
MENFRDRILNEFEPQGLKFFRESIWSSALQRSDLSKIRSFLTKNNFYGIDVSLVLPSDDETNYLVWRRHYNKSGDCIVFSTSTEIPSGSNHLKITFGYPDIDSRSRARSKELITINYLRLVFGLTAARELVFTSLFDRDDSVTTISEDGYASPFDTQEINRFEHPPIEGAEVIEIPEEAALLLHKAFNQNLPQERFILMWLAFESITNFISNKGSNGQKRQAYFKETLKSETANEEVKRLFSVRCDLFKEGRMATSSIEDDCWSLNRPWFPRHSPSSGNSVSHTLLETAA